MPHGFFGDEASIGYNAYSLLTKGVDEYRKPFPLFFHTTGEGPIKTYATIPLVGIFGPTEFSVRLGSAIFGTFTIIIIYLLTKKLFGDTGNARHIALVAAFFLAISPWHIHFSRVGFDLISLLFFTTLAVYYFIKSQEKIKFLLLSTIFFSLSLYTYFPARLFIPLFLFGIIFTYISFLLSHKKEVMLNIFLFLLLIFPLIMFTFPSIGLSRWNQVSIFTSPQKNKTALIHITQNYLSHFSLDFLFLQGDIYMPGQFLTRHSIRGMGELYLFQLPLVLFGFLYLGQKKQCKSLIILSIWIALYPIGSMFTIDESAQATRSIIGVIPLQILSATGFYYCINFFLQIKKYKFIFIVFFTSMITVVTLSFIYFLFLYFVGYPLYSSGYWGWQYGYRDAVAYLKKHEKQFDQLFVTHRYNDPETLLMFYNLTYHCKNCFVIANPITINMQQKQLFALRKEDVLEANIRYNNLQFIKQKIIYLPDGTEEIFIGSFTKKK